MVSPLVFSQLMLIALGWLCGMLQWAWPSDTPAACPSTLAPPPPRPQRHRAPRPCADCIKKLLCEACAPATAPRSLPQPGRHLDTLLSEPDAVGALAPSHFQGHGGGLRRRHADGRCLTQGSVRQDASALRMRQHHRDTCHLVSQRGASSHVHVLGHYLGACA